MVTRIFFFLIGFGLTIIGCVYIITYMNLMTIGYNFSEYVNFIIRRIECFYAVIGLLIIIVTIYMPGGKRDELYLRCVTKL
ncbi:MAG: hypothetical protein PHW32_01775 [Bacilli bacterium]|nr:hypothetical protein [Bacilli bacterium]MDD4282319.1 hypothetical protein [Bacilli bacterium]MDD4718323.1 hypothetical protein [Bacilli bacterium]